MVKFNDKDGNIYTKENSGKIEYNERVKEKQSKIEGGVHNDDTDKAIVFTVITIIGVIIIMVLSVYVFADLVRH